MALSPNLLLPATQVVTVGFGCLLTFLTYKAYRRTGSRSLKALAAGFSLLLGGSVLGGGLHEFADLPLEASVTVQSMFTALGFAVLAYSLYTGESHTGARSARASARHTVEHLRR
jgi:hypothetical protein